MYTLGGANNDSPLCLKLFNRYLIFCGLSSSTSSTGDVSVNVKVARKQARSPKHVHTVEVFISEKTCRYNR